MGVITVTVDKSLDLTINTAGEEIEYEEIRARIEAFYRGMVTKHVMWDFSHVKTFNLSAEEIERLAEFTSRMGKGSRRGGCNVIVTRRELIFGFSRMFAAYAEFSESDQKNGIFPSREAAFKWIAQQDGLRVVKK